MTTTTDPNDLSIAQDTIDALEAAEAELIADADFDGVSYELTEDGDVNVDVEYAKTPYDYHREVWYGNYVGMRAYDVLNDYGFPYPTDDPKTGVFTSHQDDTVIIRGKVPAAMTDGGVLAGAATLIEIGALSLLPFALGVLVDLGEEYMVKNSLETSFDLGLYDSSTDTLGDTSDLANITSEPGGASYARQVTASTALDSSGDWGIDNDSQESFDLSDTNSGNVDGWFFETSFTASDTGDGSATDHLILYGSLSQTYDLASVDTLNISAGSVGVTVS